MISSKYLPNIAGKERVRDYVIDPNTNERIFDDNHKDVVRTGMTVLRDLKRRWWCYDCKLYFLAYDDRREAQIAADIIKAAGTYFVNKEGVNYSKYTYQYPWNKLKHLN